jgi:TolB-like protein/DNA-binding winged helix-turn-helix (wHTH) protein/Tfp pilus assembly protein PilF
MRDVAGFDAVTPLGEASSLVRFAGLVLNLDAWTLARDSGEAIALTRGEFALLRMFVARPGRVISRDALMNAFTDRRFESFDRSVDVLVAKLRRRIEPDPKQPRLIVTVPGEGYRFDGLTQPLSPPSIAEPTPRESPDRRHGSNSPLAEQSSNLGATRGAKMPIFERREPPRLSIVVLPFANIGGGPEQDHFVDGVTESLTTDLSRIRGAFVIARNTAFTYKGKPLDAKMIGGELNVRYVLEGSVQRGGNRMRVNVQLIAAETGNHLWAERFDKPLADLFDMQDEIVARLAGALDAQLVAAEARRAEQGPTPDSMDLYFQGMSWFHKGLNPDNLTQASSFFDRALAVDPGNVDALIGSARVDVGAAASVFVTDSAAAFFAAEAKAIRVLSLVTDHARGHMVLGVVYIYTKRAARGIAECEHALALDRNLAQAHTYIGLGKIFIGRMEETEAHIVEALRLSPRDTMVYSWMSYAGIAKNYLGLYDQAIPWFRRAIETNRNASHPHFVLGVALALLGRLDEARSAVKAGLAINPTFTISRGRAAWSAMSDDPTHLAQLERLLEGMRKAGVPE